MVSKSAVVTRKHAGAGLSLHSMGVICGLAAGVWLGGQRLPPSW